MEGSLTPRDTCGLVSVLLGTVTTREAASDVVGQTRQWHAVCSLFKLRPGTWGPTGCGIHVPGQARAPASNLCLTPPCPPGAPSLFPRSQPRTRSAPPPEGDPKHSGTDTLHIRGINRIHRWLWFWTWAPRAHTLSCGFPDSAIRLCVLSDHRPHSPVGTEGAWN